MQIKTRDFGTIEVTEDRVYHFTQPLFGFEQYSDFIILHDEEIGGSIVWLQSTQEPQLCFIMMDPGTVAKGYAPPLPPEFDRLLGEGDCYCWVVAVVPENFRDATVNLKSPVYLNTTTQKGAQIILEGDYPVRFPIAKGGES